MKKCENYKGNYNIDTFVIINYFKKIIFFTLCIIKGRKELFSCLNCGCPMNAH